MRYKSFITWCMLSIGIPTVAETWSLEQCVDYAINNNLNVRNARLNIAEGEQNITDAKDRFMPSLNASASESMSFGRGLTASNTYADRNTTNFQWGASLNLPLFQGLSEYRQVDMARANLTRLLYEFEATKDNITLNVISQYLQVLYAKEVLKSAERQLEHTTFEVERQRTLVEEGKVAEADLFDAEALMAQDQLQVVTAENDIKVSLVELANLLQLPSAEGFDIYPVTEDEPIIPTSDAVFNAALSHNNSIMASRQGIKVADSNISLAKCGYIPHLNFNAGLGSSYYTVGGYKSDSFREQMRHNYSTYLGFSLSIPIFDGFSTRNSIRKAKLQKLSAELELDRQESELFKTIQLAYYQARGARDKYFASQKTLEKTTLSYEATREKYNLGRATPSEYEQVKNNLFKTEISSIQAHYEYLLRYRILIFYQNNSI
ncbi:MAG: TolC family protein, partial [Bacteroidales bacterium]|nr:TolC family protein [Bacteroidales bacterium]